MADRRRQRRRPRRRLAARHAGAGLDPAEIATLAVASLLLFRTRAVLSFGLMLLALAAGSLLLAYGRGWRGQRWLVAIGVDAVVALLGGLWLFGRTPPAWLDRETLLTLQIGLAVLYLYAFVLRLLMQERRVTGFAVTQTVLVLLLGFEPRKPRARRGGWRRPTVRQATPPSGAGVHA